MNKKYLFALGWVLFGTSLSPHALALAAKGAAEVKVGTAVEKMVLKGEAKTFKVALGSKIWVWTKVNDMADSKIEIIFEKEGRVAFKQQLQVPRNAYRTYAYHTFRKGDGGAWTAKVLDPDGTVLGSSTFSVEVE